MTTGTPEYEVEPHATSEYTPEYKAYKANPPATPEHKANPPVTPEYEAKIKGQSVPWNHSHNVTTCPSKIHKNICNVKNY